MLSEDRFVFSQDDLPSASFLTFNEMRSNGDLCDVTFRVENLQIKAHRLLLAANIPYFRAMFLSNMAESSRSEINFQGMKYDIFVSLIHSAYGCRVEVSLDNVMSLLVGASFLQMDQVCDACCAFLSERLHLDNVLGLREFAGIHGFPKLKQSTDEYLQTHFAEISNKDEFLDLPFSDFKELISKDQLCVPSEEVVFQGVMAWIKRSEAGRKDKLPELLTFVRMPLLSYRYLSYHVASEELIQNSVACKHLLEEAKDHRILREKVSNPCSFTTKQRSLLETKDARNFLYAVCKKEEGFPYAFVERFDLKIRRWTAMESKTMCVEDTTVAVLGENIYVIGGCDRQGKVLDIVQVFDTKSDSWSTVAVLKSPKKLVAAAVLSDRLYVCGGETEKSIINDVECYSPANKRWTNLPPMLQPRSAACAVPCGVHIYVMGGCAGDTDAPNCKLRSVERYNTDVEQWSLVSEMNFSPYRCGVTSLNDKIYAHSEKCIEMYDPWGRKWVNFSHAPPKKGGFTLLTIGGRLCVIGESGCMITYDPETSEWSNIERIHEKVHVIGAVISCAD